MHTTLYRIPTIQRRSSLNAARYRRGLLAFPRA